jgi:hypothetical protein
MASFGCPGSGRIAGEKSGSRARTRFNRFHSCKDTTSAGRRMASGPKAAARCNSPERSIAFVDAGNSAEATCAVLGAAAVAQPGG